MPKRRMKEKKKAKEGMSPSSYLRMPHYFPTEQIDIAKMVKPRNRTKKR